MAGTVDIYHSRRTNYDDCLYYERDESNREPPSKWILNKIPTDSFYAKETSSEEVRMAQLGNVFAFDERHITIDTDDDVHLRRGYIVEYNNENWIIENIQSRVHHKESEFDREKHYRTYINLRR